MCTCVTGGGPEEQADLGSNDAEDASSKIIKGLFNMSVCLVFCSTDSEETLKDFK